MNNYTNLKLGALPPKLDRRTIKLAAIIRPKLLPPLPDAFDLDTARGITNHPMFLNDKLGCCVISSTANMTRNFEIYEQGKQICPSDDDVRNQYYKETGGQDVGLVELYHLRTWRKDGFVVGDKVYKIHAFAAVNWKNHTEVKYCIYLLNGIFLGLALPITAQSQDVWDIPANPDFNGKDKPGSWGYHAVIGQAYPTDNPVVPPKTGCIVKKAISNIYSNAYKPILGALKRKEVSQVVGVSAIGPIILTWGKRLQVTWAWWDVYLNEAYAVIDEKDLWMPNSPIDTDELEKQLAEITTS